MSNEIAFYTNLSKKF